MGPPFAPYKAHNTSIPRPADGVQTACLAAAYELLVEVPDAVIPFGVSLAAEHDLDAIREAVWRAVRTLASCRIAI